MELFDPNDIQNPLTLLEKIGKVKKKPVSVSLAVSEPYFLFSAPKSAKLALDKISGNMNCILDSLCIYGSLRNLTSSVQLLSQLCESWTKMQVISVAFLIAYVSLAVSEPYFLFSAAQPAQLAMDKLAGNISCIL